MKKLFLLICVCAFGMTAMAQNLDKVIEKYKSTAKAECMTINKDMINMMLAMAGSQTDMSDEDREQMEMMKDIDQMTTITIEDADAATGEALLSDVRNALDKGYEIMDANDGNDKVMIATKQKKKKDNHVSEVVIAAYSDNSAVLLYITGKLAKDKIGNLMNLGK